MKKSWRLILEDIKMSKKMSIFFGVIIMIVISIGMYRKNINVESSMVSIPNSQIEFSTNNEFIEQTWAPHVKKIVQLKVPFRAENSFKGIVEAKVLSDDGNHEIGTSVLTYDFKEYEESELIFSFDTLRVDLGSRYRFQIRFLEETEDGKIIIPSDKESYGCSIDGEVLGEAVNFKIISEKNSRAFWLISTFLPFIFVALFIAVIFNKKIEETLGMAFVANGMLLFIFGLFEKLQLGIFVVFLFSFLCFIISIILCWKKDINVCNYLTPGVVIYGAIVIYVILTCHDLLRREWDEYNHWGLAVKDMFYYNAFAKHIDTSVPLMRYPPFTTLIEYFFIYNNEMFSEGILYVAYLALLFSFIVVIFKNCNWKNISNIFVTGIVSVLLPMIFFEHYYFIYVDLMLGILFAYILICYFSEELTLFNIMRISGGLIALVLTKDMGLVLAGLFVIGVAIDLLYRQIKSRRKIQFNKFIPVGIFALLTMLSFVIWQIYIAIPAKTVTEISSETSEVVEKVGNVSSTISASQISLSGVIELVSGQAPEYKYDIIKNYLYNLFEPDTWEVGNLGFSYIIFLLCIIISAVYLYRKEKNGNYLKFTFMSILISMGYAAFLLITYLFSFPYNDAIVLHSHERYLASCIGGITIAFWSLVLLEKREKNTKECNFLTTIICTVLIFGVHIGNLYPDNLAVYITEDKIYGYDEIEIMSRCFTDKSESVYYVYNDSRNGALEQIIFRNYLSPLESTGGTFFASQEAIDKEKLFIELNNESEKTSVMDNIKTVDEWREELKEHEYVFLHHPGYVFSEYYGSLFEDPSTIEDRAYYSVEKQGETIKLEYIGKVQLGQ